MIKNRKRNMSWLEIKFQYFFYLNECINIEDKKENDTRIQEQKMKYKKVYKKIFFHFQKKITGKLNSSW